MSNKRRSERGFTLAEVLVAAALMAIALSPAIKALINAHVIGTKSQRATQALLLADKKTEDIRAAALNTFNQDFNISSESLGGGYLCTVTDEEETGTLKKIQVVVGYDVNGDSVLDADEIDITLDTRVASRE